MTKKNVSKEPKMSNNLEKEIVSAGNVLTAVCEGSYSL